MLACDMRQGTLESGCEDAAIVLACDIRQGSLCTGLRDLLWFLLDIAFTNTRWPQEGQQAPKYARDHQRVRNHTKNTENKAKPPALAPLRTSQAARIKCYDDVYFFLSQVTSNPSHFRTRQRSHKHRVHASQCETYPTDKQYATEKPTHNRFVRQRHVLQLLLTHPDTVGFAKAPVRAATFHL